jgi:hypothetical protein
VSVFRTDINPPFEYCIYIQYITPAARVGAAGGNSKMKKKTDCRRRAIEIYSYLNSDDRQKLIHITKELRPHRKIKAFIG